MVYTLTAPPIKTNLFKVSYLYLHLQYIYIYTKVFTQLCTAYKYNKYIFIVSSGLALTQIKWFLIDNWIWYIVCTRTQRAHTHLLTSSRNFSSFLFTHKCTHIATKRNCCAQQYIYIYFSVKNLSKCVHLVHNTKHILANLSW